MLLNFYKLMVFGPNVSILDENFRKIIFFRQLSESAKFSVPLPSVTTPINDDSIIFHAVQNVLSVWRKRGWRFGGLTLRKGTCGHCTEGDNMHTAGKCQPVPHGQSAIRGVRRWRWGHRSRSHFQEIFSSKFCILKRKFFSDTKKISDRLKLR